MKRVMQSLAAVLLSTAAGLMWADELGVTMSIMAEDDQDLTGSVSRQIELAEPVARQSRSERLILLGKLRARISEEQRQQLLSAPEGEDLTSSEQMQILVDGLNDQELVALVEGLSGSSLISLLETLDSNRSDRMVEELSGQEQEELLNEIIDESDSPNTEEEAPVLEEDPNLLEPLPLTE